MQSHTMDQSGHTYSITIKTEGRHECVSQNGQFTIVSNSQNNDSLMLYFDNEHPISIYGAIKKNEETTCEMFHCKKQLTTSHQRFYTIIGRNKANELNVTLPKFTDPNISYNGLQKFQFIIKNNKQPLEEKIFTIDDNILLSFKENRTEAIYFKFFKTDGQTNGNINFEIINNQSEEYCYIEKLIKNQHFSSNKQNQKKEKILPKKHLRKKNKHITHNKRYCFFLLLITSIITIVAYIKLIKNRL